MLSLLFDHHVYHSTGFLIITFITRPIVVTYKSTESLIPNPIIDVDQSTKYILQYLWVIGLFYSICAVPISFYYRYRILCKNKCFPIKLQVGLLLFALFLSVTYSLHAYYAFHIRTKQFYGISEEFLAPWFADVNGKVNPAGFVGYFDYYVYIFMTHAAILTVGAYYVIIWCSWRVYKFMKYHQQIRQVHKSFVDIHNQLTRTLIAQALIPLFTFATPIIFIIITVTTPVYIHPIISAGIATSFSYIPLANALSIFVFVKSYRKRGFVILKNGLKKIFHKNGPSTVIISVS
uniref:Opsin n=1 Tax=Panagrolaimus sp. JU765 TaxID=591449 RepID=A0AC34QSE7_9BILA